MPCSGAEAGWIYRRICDGSGVRKGVWRYQGHPPGRRWDAQANKKPTVFENAPQISSPSRAEQGRCPWYLQTPFRTLARFGPWKISPETLAAACLEAIGIQISRDNDGIGEVALSPELRSRYGMSPYCGIMVENVFGVKTGVGLLWTYKADRMSLRMAFGISGEWNALNCRVLEITKYLLFDSGMR
jgi:hypothetical protein